MPTSELHITRRHLPHWSSAGATYFVTSRAIDGKLTVEEEAATLEHIKGGHNKFYTLVAAVVMPDHFHLIVMADMGYDLTAIMRGIKGVSARKINLGRCTVGSVWQDESFDRIIRSEQELYGKLQYMLNNPLKAGLTDDPWSYHGWYCNEGFFKR
jgi:putative transposase